jgi:hypothetical protein
LASFEEDYTGMRGQQNIKIRIINQKKEKIFVSFDLK